MRVNIQKRRDTLIRTDKLKGIMAERGVSGKELAGKIGIAPKTFYEKMRQGKFGTDEAEVMIEELGIENPIDIFFAKV